jgi:predicted transcriptional regulator
MNKPTLGDQELEVLQFVAERAPIAMNQAAEQFGEMKGLARTTVLTVLERLRKKGYLTRRKKGSVYHYSPTLSKTQILHGLVSDFVEQRLGGSLHPFIAYLAQEPGLSEEEFKKLEQLVRKMEAQKLDVQQRQAQPKEEQP